MFIQRGESSVAAPAFLALRHKSDGREFWRRRRLVHPLRLTSPTSHSSCLMDALGVGSPHRIWYRAMGKMEYLLIWDYIRSSRSIVLASISNRSFSVKPVAYRRSLGDLNSPPYTEGRPGGRLLGRALGAEPMEECSGRHLEVAAHLEV